MKIFTLISLICLIVGTTSVVSAAEATPSATATPSAKTTPIEKKAQDLLDRVATKVAQIAKTNSRTYHGVIKSVGTNSYVITAAEGEQTIVTNDATDFYRIRAGKRSTSNFQGMKVGEDIVAVGTIDPNTKTMTAKQVIQKIKRTIFAGPIEAVDKAVITIKGNKIDLSDASYQKIDADGKITPATLADFKVGTTTFVLAHTPEDNIYSSLKALTISN